MTPQALTALHALEDAPTSAAEWKRRALAAEKQAKELELAAKEREYETTVLMDELRIARMTLPQ